VDLVYPVDICRKIDRQWQRRASAARPRARPTRRAADDRVCPLCHAPVPIAAAASTHLEPGLIHHHWLCVPCGCVWTTVARLPG
jgi:hypothetical protein